MVPQKIFLMHWCPPHTHLLICRHVMTKVKKNHTVIDSETIIKQNMMSKIWSHILSNPQWKASYFVQWVYP